MVKFIYPIWKPSTLSGDDFREQLLGELIPQLRTLNQVESLRIAVVDSAVAPATARRMENCQPLPDGVISLYMSGLDRDTWDEKSCADTLIQNSVERASCYQVSETEVLKHDVTSGERIQGFCQIVFLQRPSRLSEAAWLELWQGSHTQVAIDTQATFGYRQNVITRRYTDAAPELHAMIEENFPDQAMASDQAFYGARDDEDLQLKLAAMLESCARFIDFDKIDVIPMSEYFFQA
ncbi:MAG: hypothetical protein IMF06_06950 [Proteobacteria bacterium]|nr:hypothetical protein [Pseudomonadota bacterium]